MGILFSSNGMPELQH